MAAPFNDIGINPFTSDRREFGHGVATATGIKYGMVVINDSGTTNSRDSKLPSGAASKGVRGVVCDQGDPNNSGGFAVGDEFAICEGGVTEVLIDANASAVKAGDPAITSATAGTVKKWTNETDVDVVGTFEQDYDNSANATPVLVALRVNVYRKT